jgi:Ca2+-binding RTX toxin-like protein
VIARGGNDQVSIAGNISTRGLIDGGAGGDDLSAGGGPTIILGGTGNDAIDGNSGRDVLIGGDGADRIVGNGNDDILIAGFTSFDSDYSALNAILAEWSWGAAFATRQAHLRGTLPGGLNGTAFLAVDGPARTVFDDGDIDSLTG